MLFLCRFVVLTSDDRVVHYCKYNTENDFKYTLTVFAGADLLNKRIVNGTEKKTKTVSRVHSVLDCVVSPCRGNLGHEKFKIK